MKDITILQALEYEKITFDDDLKKLYSETLPVTLFMGRLAHDYHQTLIPQLSLDGQNMLLYSKDKDNLNQLVENAYISSWLNGKVRASYYHTYEHKTFHLTGFSYATLKEDIIISQFDNLYKECKENESLPDNEKALYIVMISDLSEMPFLKMLFKENQVNYISSIVNPFENKSCQEQADTYISVNEKIKDMLINGKKYGVVFIIGESDFESYSKLKQYPFHLLELDSIDTLNIVTRQKEMDKVLAWSSNASQEVDLFLANESPFYEAVKAYCNVDF